MRACIFALDIGCAVRYTRADFMDFSRIGQQLNVRTGINDLMEDMYEAIYSGRPNLCQLNGGAPAMLPELVRMWRASMERIMEQGEFESLVCSYQHPRGHEKFIQSLVKYLNDRYGWGITPENVAVTQGGQMAFFLLFNLLAGEGSPKSEILFPLCPDYVGYQAQSLVGPSLFRGVKPRIQRLGNHVFKYGIDFENLEIRPETAAISLSRPANPTGNVVTDEELDMLRAMAKAAGIPVMVDNAYGQPFPDITSVPCNTVWDENMVLSLSLSKIGLPGTRTGIIIARKEIIDTVMNAVTVSALCPNNLGQALVEPYLADGSLDAVCRDVVKPYYRKRAAFAESLLRQYFDDELPWHVHKSEGAMFLWLWMDGLPIPVQELYERCRERGCYVNPGHHFFFALPPEDRDWRHQHECVRLSFTQPDDVLHRGIRILAEEVARAYKEA